jgi:beta-1,4-mannosyl-glycoprotein beta-1,4-N-acetylglucosaminyltransferase
LNNIYPDYCIYLTKNKNTILTEIPSKITFVYEVFDTSIFEQLPNTDFSLLNTEPLNIPYRLQSIKNIQKLYNGLGLGYYDYSKSNFHILTENGIDFKYKTYLPYICSSSELLQLQKVNKNTEKVFDFGIIKTLGGEISPRRQKIVNFLKSNHFSVNIIEGWNNDRDNELAKCKLVLNIHGNLGDDVSMIFEHIRCNRLLESGFNILSETCYNLNVDFKEKYPNLKLINYDEFFNISNIIECYNNKLGSLEHNKYVLDILNNTHRILDIPCNHIQFLENLFLEFNIENMIIYDIGSSVLHWSQHAKQIWKDSTIYLFDGMTEMKLFYDEYNSKNNTTYEYNVGVLCDEDYKRISFYQSDELSGGNSYYKEIGHRDSDKIFTEQNIKQKIGMKLETIVKIKNIPAPDLIKIDVQGAELDILKGSMELINNAKFLIVELQHTEYNKGAPLCNQTRDFLIENGWEVYAEKFSNNGPDADWCFINKNYKSLNLNFIQNQLKIIDCFIFYNELDLLTYRLNILNDVVDYFVLVESTHTFVGKEKPLFYQENRHLFDKFNHKIIHIVVDDFPHKHPNIDFEKQEQWNNEKFQRNCISRGINKLKLNEHDIITVTDLDEIPNPKLFEKIKANKLVIDINTIELDFYYYNLNFKMDHHCYLSKMMSYKKYKELGFTFEQIRQNMSFKIINNAGWHLSYFGDANFIKNKIENFSHQELNLELFTNQEKIQNRIKNKQDLFDRDIKICHINIEDNDNLPPSYDVYLKNYYTNGTNNMNNYKYTQTWFLGSDSLDKFLDKSTENKILEIGCFEGLSSVFFADNFLDNQKSSLTCVDPFLTINNNDHSQYLQNNEEMNFDFNISICENSDRIIKHKITSDKFFENNNQTYNFIYLDGCHEPDFIKRDMENAFNILDKNGIMWMDDYGGGDGIQIKNTMDKFLEKYNEKYELINRGYQLAIRKR